MGRPLPSPLPRRLAGLLIAVAVVAPARAADSPPVLSTAREVAESYRLAEPRPDVDLEAVVLGTIPGKSILLRDDTGTTFASVPYAGPAVEPGDRVRVRGRPSTGALIDGIGDATVEGLGAGPPPAPRLIHARDLTTGECFHDLITVSGVGRLVREDATVGTVVLVHTDGGTVEVRCERPLATAEAARLVDAELAITGFGAGEVNLARQIVRPFLRVVSADGLRVVGPAPADPFAVDDVPLDRIDRSIRSGHRVKVSGVASAPGGTGGGVFIAAGDRGLFIEPAALDATVRRIAPGDLVEAVGFPAADAAAMYLAAATLRVVGRGEPPRPRLLPDQAVFPETSDWFDYFRTVSCDALPIAVEIEVDSLRDEPAGVELHGHMPLRRIMFACHVPARLPRSVGPGSHILVRGVCRVTATMRDRYIAFPSAFDVWPASAADVVVVKAVPWWTRGEVVAALGWLLAGVALVAVAATTLAFLLRRTVRRQVALLEQKMQNEAVLEERQRIAREVHDSLEQDLAGLALRLDATASTAADDRLRGMLERQRSLVSRLQAETRHFIWDLRDPSRAHWSFPDLLAAQIEDQEVVVGVPIRLRVEGQPADVPLATRHHLLRIVREAVANAAQHGQASAIDVVVAGRTGGGATVAINDDGIGFDPAASERKRGHFGLRGMRERARRIGAVLAIDSRPGMGTRVSVTLGMGASGGEAGADIGGSDSGRPSAGQG